MVLACTFTPPPPLPEELAVQQAQEAARLEAVRGGTPQSAPEAEGSGTKASEPSAAAEVGEQPGNPYGYRKGEPADVGMTPEQMQVYAQVQGDPAGGVFTLEQALANLPGEGELWVEMNTTQGTIACRLFEDRTPLTVANFVGLARGLRPAFDAETGAWVSRPYYDGVEFHRVIPGFVIQGGDPSGSGRGRIGYVIPDEIVGGLKHAEAGILSMANRGPGTGAAQFFVTLAPLPHLDGKHTAFGQCDEAGIQVAEKIAAMRGSGDRPRTPQVIETMVISRR